MSDRASTTTSDIYAVIAGGGTAGHVVPGLAIADALVGLGHPAGSVLFVGSERGVEASMVSDAGFEAVLLPGRGIQRRVTWANLAALAGIVRAVVSAWTLLGRRRPRVVVAMGGYASVPCAVAAFVRRIPIVVAEQNAVPGLANRLSARVARASAVSFPDTGLPREVLTGNPVRNRVLELDRAVDGDRARAELGIERGRHLLAVYGGSLGARRLNEALLEALEVWGRRTDLAVRHIVGSRDHAALVPRVPPIATPGIQYQLVEFERDMPTVLCAADLVVSRAGATSVADFAALGVPSVLVPLPGAPGDHQTANARHLADAGAAVLVPDGELTGARLAELVVSLLDDRARLDAMSAAAAGLGRPHAGRDVARLVEEYADA